MPGRPDSVLNPILTAAQLEQKNKDLTAFSSLTPEQLAAKKTPPTWNDVFDAFNTQHKAVYGKEINRTWNTDQDTKSSKLAIDNLYQQSVDAWNKANNGSAKVDTTVLGVNAQPNTYTPDTQYHGLLNQLFETVKPLAPLALAAVGANFLAPALADLFGAEVIGGGGGVAEGLVGGGGAGTSINEMIASGLAPGSVGATGAVAGALTPAELAAASGTGLVGAGVGGVTPLSNIAATGTQTLTPAALESLAGTAGYGTNASAVNAAINAGINPAIVGAGAGGTIADLLAGTTGAAAVTPAVTSLNEMVASGTAPGSVGATGAATGTLTGPALNAATGVTGVTGTTGITGTTGTTGTTTTPGLLDALTSATGLTGTQLAALLSGLTGAGNAANLTSAIDTGLNATTAANAASQGVLKDIYGQQLGFQKPYQTAGTNALSQLGALGTGQYQQYDPVTGQPTTMGTGSGYLQHQFDASDLAKGLAPNYDFMLQQGQMANQRAANVGGGALSGNTLQGLQNYTQNYAGNAYQNAFNNYQTQRQNIYGNLAGMAGMGQTANTGAQAAGTSYGKGVTDLNTALANAQAAASIGKAQALAGGTSGLANSTFLASLLAPPK